MTKRTGSDGATTWSGKLVVPGAASKGVVDGATSTIAVTAAGTAMEGADGQEKPIVPRPDGTCPFGLARAGAICRITCTVSMPNAVTWKVPPPIKATLSAGINDATTATLSWETENATEVTVTGPGLPGGSLKGKPTGSWPAVKRLLKDETYTLTASAPDMETKTATAPVPAAGPFAITLWSGGNDVTTDSQVTVGGKVTPPPPAGTVVAVGVNGIPVANVTAGGDGSYFATIQLPNTTSVGALVLTNPNRNLIACGSHPPSIVTLANTASPAAVQNFINAAVVKTGGGTNSSAASLTITHAVGSRRRPSAGAASARAPAIPSPSRGRSCALETAASWAPSPVASSVRAPVSPVRRSRQSRSARRSAHSSRMVSGPSRFRSGVARRGLIGLVVALSVLVASTNTGARGNRRRSPRARPVCGTSSCSRPSASTCPSRRLHARNLFHLSVAMWDAWAAYDPVAAGYLVKEKHGAVHVHAARTEAISYAAFRVLTYRFPVGHLDDDGRPCHPNAAISQAAFEAEIRALGFDPAFTSTEGDSPAALGNRIAAAVIREGQTDGANEGAGLCFPDDTGYFALNPPLIFKLPGAGDVLDPNRWQPLAFDFLVTQNGIPLGAGVQAFAGVGWGRVRPFALEPSDRNPLTGLYLDPGPHPHLGGVGDDVVKARWSS